MADGISHREFSPGQDIPAGIGTADITAADHGQQLRVDILQEGGLPGGLIHGIGLITGQIEHTSCPCHSHVKEPSLLFHFILIGQLFAGELALDQAVDKDGIEFQAFGGMDGHDPDGILVMVVVLTREKGKVRQEVFQAQRLLILLFHGVDGRDELRYIVQLPLVHIGLQFFTVAQIQYFTGQLRGRELLKGGMQLHNALIIFQERSFSDSPVQDHGTQPVDQFHIFCPGQGPELLKGLFSEAPAGTIDGLFKIQIIQSVDHPQIGKDRPDFLRAVEPGATEDLIGYFPVHKGFFQGPGHGGRSDKYSVILPPAVGADSRQDPVRDP